jgi:hypothetical protein
VDSWPYDVSPASSWDAVDDDARRIRSRSRAVWLFAAEPSPALIDAIERRYGAALFVGSWCQGTLALGDAIERACNVGEADVLSNEWRDDAEDPGAPTLGASPAPTDACVPEATTDEQRARLPVPCDGRCRGGENLGPLVRATRAAEWDAYWADREAREAEMRVACVLSAARAQAWGSNAAAYDDASRAGLAVTKHELLARRAGEKEEP